MKYGATATDGGSTNVESTIGEELDAKQEAGDEAGEPPSESDLDMAHDCLMKAEKIKSDNAMMKHLKPHMAMKLKHLKGALGKVDKPEPIKSTDGLRAKEKTIKY